MGTKGVEMVIWDRLERLEGDKAVRRSITKASVSDREKQGLTSHKKNNFRGPARRTVAIVVSLLLINLWFRLYSQWEGASTGNVTDVGSHPSDSTQESFEITIEQMPETPPVFTQEILQHSFGDSWGKPFTAKFQPYKEGSYDSVILELNTNVSGRQFDRLVHVFIEDINVWRSSTVEPWGNKTILSHSIKDITQYKSLFKGESLKISLQLDNLVTNKLTGVFNVSLRAHYYKNEEKHHVASSSLREKLFEMFTAPAHIITPLVTRFSRTPLLYYPLASQENPRWSRGLPEIDSNFNVSRAMIEIFASGNAAEEFWYTNVLDRYVNRFRKSGHELLGHGPFRAIKVYLTDSEREILIDTIIPTPIIFTGFFPPLWRPCVGMNAFNIKSYKVDLTPFLSLFESGTWELQLEVVSSIDSDFKPTVGENWIISGNVLVWCNNTPVTSSKFINSTALPPVFDVVVNTSRSDELTQDLFAFDGVQIDSLITIDDVEYECRQVAQSKLTNNQTYLRNGNFEQAYVNLFTIRKFVISRDGIDLYQYVDETGWRFGATMETESDKHSELTLSASIGRKLDRLVALQEMNTQNGTEDTLLSLNGVQKGNTTYTLSPAGNHGSGDSVHSVRVKHVWPFKNSFQRTVVVKDNQVIADRTN
ncbi:LANO_0G05424g1_1 [Lachancea nothofagi CBS 11611]|uniref:LANO_0G05424g1_1 n=1 Tax=Lachancea nothofagi CBS 11611 TaxID=1266666 RepID=A0A1G4KGE3_9SACH|nr:LANO_0G05424g1_1 [Lachancea nothofagi CBS 11611]